ncbi:unnamed protein product [Closterium sp. Naga37s-1]|nr:unnamed protein product [Closterium sp. Naga37s-1]
MFPTCDLVSKCAYGSGRAMGQSEERKSSRRGERLRAFHHMMPTDDVTNSLFHVSSNSPDVWWSLPDGISEKLPLPPGRWQRIEVRGEGWERAGVGLAFPLALSLKRSFALNREVYRLANFPTLVRLLPLLLVAPPSLAVALDQRAYKLIPLLLHPTLPVPLPIPLASPHPARLSPSRFSHPSPYSALPFPLPIPPFGSVSPSHSSHPPPHPSRLSPSRQTQDMYYYLLMPGNRSSELNRHFPHPALLVPSPIALFPSLSPSRQTQDMYYYLLMPGAQCTLNQLQQDGSREDGSREDGSRKDESKRSTASGPPRSDEPITYFTAHSRLRSHLEAVGDSVLALTCVLHLVRQQPPLSMGDLTSRKDKLVSNRSLAGIGAEVLGLRGAMLSFSDALLMQGKRAVSVGGGQVESSLVACTMEALVGAVYAEKGLEAASAFVTRLLPSLVDSRTAAPHSQKLEFGHEHEQESGHEHGHEYQQRLQQQDGGSDVRVGDAAAVGGMEFPEECDPVARLQEMSVQQLGLVPQYRAWGSSLNTALFPLPTPPPRPLSPRPPTSPPHSLPLPPPTPPPHTLFPFYPSPCEHRHTGTDNPHTPHVTERVRVYAAGRRMGTGMGPTLEEAKRDGATKALLAWGKVFSGEGGSEEAGREASECAEERTGD